MKPILFVLPIAAGAIAFVSGCQSGSSVSGNETSSAAAPVSAPAAAARTTTPAVAAPPTSARTLPSAIRINAGMGAVKDSAGVEWLDDTGFVGGDVIDRPDLPIANTTQPEIYRSEHYSMDSFAQKLPNGRYQVKLHFCETYEGIYGPGDRVFSFEVEGKAFKDFDVWVKAGGGARAYVETVVVDIADGQLDITFTPQVENPQINGIEIIPQP